MASLPFPKPVIITAPRLASAPTSTLAELARTLDAAQRALRELEAHARFVPGVLAARVRNCAAEAADNIEAHGYDLFLATGEDRGNDGTT